MILCFSGILLLALLRLLSSIFKQFVLFIQRIRVKIAVKFRNDVLVKPRICDSLTGGSSKDASISFLSGQKSEGRVVRFITAAGGVFESMNFILSAQFVPQIIK